LRAALGRVLNLCWRVGSLRWHYSATGHSQLARVLVHQSADISISNGGTGRVVCRQLWVCRGTTGCQAGVQVSAQVGWSPLLRERALVRLCSHTVRPRGPLIPSHGTCVSIVNPMGLRGSCASFQSLSRMQFYVSRAARACGTCTRARHLGIRCAVVALSGPKAPEFIKRVPTTAIRGFFPHMRSAIGRC